MTFMVAGWSPSEVDCCIGAIVAGVLVVSERPPAIATTNPLCTQEKGRDDGN